MFVERTEQWREVVGELETRRGELGLECRDKGRILQPSSPLVRQANKIVTSVAELARVLTSQRSGYLAAHGGMGEGERDQVDTGADAISRQCRTLIGRFKEQVRGVEGGEAARHYHGVAEGLQRYLKAVVSVHSEMRAVRVARQLRQKKLSRLEVNSLESRSKEIGGGQGRRGADIHQIQEAAQAAGAARSAGYTGYSSEEEEEFSPEEQQAMEVENDRLMEHLSSLTNQVEQVQSKVVKVAELQAVFTEKVLEQADILDHVHAQAVTATENTKEGNEAVRQAIQNKASYRVYILFILLVFSFSLLFLDWYND